MKGHSQAIQSALASAAKRSSTKSLTRRRLRRAVVMIELGFMIPILFTMFLFMIDAGRIFLTQNLLSDTAFSAARAGSISGLPGAAAAGDARTDFDTAVSVMPFQNQPTLDSVNPPACTNSDRYVSVAASDRVDFITPGLGELLSSLNSSNIQGNGFVVHAKGLALCEVVRG